jgi:hypothetical protein
MGVLLNSIVVYYQLNMQSIINNNKWGQITIVA